MVKGWMSFDNTPILQYSMVFRTHGLMLTMDDFFSVLFKKLIFFY